MIDAQELDTPRRHLPTNQRRLPTNQRRRTLDEVLVTFHPQPALAAG